VEYSEDEIRDAAKTQERVCRKLLEIMDLQADIDELLWDKFQIPLGSERWKKARPEELQRVVLMTAIQFVLFEPVDWVDGNDKFKEVSDERGNLGSELGMVFGNFKEVAELLTDQVGQCLLRPKLVFDDFGRFALLDPDFVPGHALSPK